MAVRNNVIKADDHVVVISRSAHDEFLIKVVSVDSQGAGIKAIRPKSLLNMLKAAGQAMGELEEDDDGDAYPTDLPLSAKLAATGPPNLLRGSVLMPTKPGSMVYKPSDLKEAVASGPQ